MAQTFQSGSLMSVICVVHHIPVAYGDIARTDF